MPEDRLARHRPEQNIQGIGVFVGAALGAIAITLVTVSFQAVKAALMNPVESLRME